MPIMLCTYRKKGGERPSILDIKSTQFYVVVILISNLVMHGDRSASSTVPGLARVASPTSTNKSGAHSFLTYIRERG